METKLSEPLRQLLQTTDASNLVDVIVELHRGEQHEAPARRTRDQHIAHLQEALNRKIGPLEEIVRSIGGEITGKVWLNQTLRVRLPADKISLLSDHDEVAKLDVPHLIKRDVSR